MLWEALLIVLLSLLDVSKQKYMRQQTAVGCYKCHSINGSDAHCGDPFHPAYNTQRYYPKCEQGQANRIGLFPARYCTKIKGTNLRTNEEIIVRSCDIAAFDNTCGLFEFKSTRYSGCLMSCGRDACNNSISAHRHNNNAALSLLLAVFSIFITRTTITHVATFTSFVGL